MIGCWLEILFQSLTFELVAVEDLAGIHSGFLTGSLKIRWLIHSGKRPKLLSISFHIFVVVVAALF